MAGTNTTSLDYRRDRHRQEVIARAIHELQPPPKPKSGQGELRGDASRPARKRALRHERERLRAPSILMSAALRWRIVARCSSTKLETCHWSSTQAAPRAPGARVEAVGSTRQRESMFAWLLQPTRPEANGSRPRIPRRFVLPPECFSDLSSAPTRKESRYPELVEHFVQQFADSMDKTIEIIPENHARPGSPLLAGNIRELQNYIARGVILSNDGIFEPGPLETCEPPQPEIVNPTLKEKIRGEILAACQSAKWRLGGPEGAAARLGLKRTTLFHKMKRLGIARPADQ